MDENTSNMWRFLRSHDKYLINYRDLETIQRIGGGAFGTVYRGKWSSAEVAIKEIQ